MTVRRLAIIVAVWALLVGALWVSDSQPAVLLLAGIVAALITALFVMIDFADSVEPVEWVQHLGSDGWVAGSDPRVRSIRRQLYGVRFTGSEEISQTLIELVDDRLLAHHQIDRFDDPSAATAILPPLLRRLVAGDRRSVGTMRGVRRVLTDIEAL